MLSLSLWRACTRFYCSLTQNNHKIRDYYAKLLFYWVIRAFFFGRIFCSQSFLRFFSCVKLKVIVVFVGKKYVCFFFQTWKGDQYDANHIYVQA